MASSKKPKIDLGDQKVARIAATVNLYVFSAFYLVVAIVMLFTKAWLTALVFVALTVFTLPQVREYLYKFHIKGILRFLICCLLLYLAFISSGLYV